MRINLTARSALVAAIATIAAVRLTAAPTATPQIQNGQPPVLAREQILIAGIGLEVASDHATVPRNIATGVDVQIVALGAAGVADPTTAIPADALVEAELRGPAFGAPVTIVALPGQPLRIQPLAIVGTYVLENIRLVSGGVTLLQAAPDTVTIDVIDKVLVSQVTTRPLTAAEIQQKGIFVDQTNFDVVNFTAAFGITGHQQTIDFPVILPKRPSAGLPASAPTPSLPPLSPAAVLPPPQALPQLQQVFQTSNIGISGLTLKIDDEDVANQFTIPPIPGVIIIPGNIAYLHQFFSVLLMVSNVAPGASNLVVRDVNATIVLPPGADTVSGSDDDPLRMARIGDPPVAQPATLSVTQPGPDGKLATADDVGTIAPGENGNAEFLVEGRKEGVQTVQIQISAMLDGLPIGPVKISGFATGIVEVRNPTFSLTLSHPATVVAGEDYDLLVTVTNTSDSPANQVSVNLLPASISGAVLTSDQSVTLSTIAAHDAATAAFHLTSQVTGNVTATSFTSDAASAAFSLTTAVGALGIPLSPNSLVLPPAADALPHDLRLAAVGLLGQAFALATSPVVPAGLKPIGQQIVYERATDVARAGQRVGMGDSLVRAGQDLALDLLGNGFTRLSERFPNDEASRVQAEADYQGFDALFRASARGAILLQALSPILAGDARSEGALAFQASWARAAASRAPFISAITGAGARGAPVVLRMIGPGGLDVGERSGAGPIARTLAFTDFLTLVDAAPLFSQLVLDAVPADGAYTVELNATGAGNFDLGLTVPAGDHLRHVTFAGVPVASGARATVGFVLGSSTALTLSIDDDGDGAPDRTIAPNVDEAIVDGGPSIVSAMQIVTGFPDPSQFGQVVGVLFSEDVVDADASAITNYSVDANQVLGASLQPGGRIVLLSLRDGVGPFFARNIAVSNVADRLGHPMTPATATLPIAMTISGQGGSFAGQVRGADGRPIAHARLQLSQTAPVAVASGALAGLGDLAATREVAVTVKDLDATGRYSLDYVRLFGFVNESVHLQAVDLDSGQTGDVVTHISRSGQHLDVDIIFVGTGTLVGRAFGPDGMTPLAGAVVKVSSLTRIGQTFGATTDGAGGYTIQGIPAGNFTIEAVHVATNSKVVLAGAIPAAGATVLENVTLIPLAQITISNGGVKGQVFHASDNTPAVGVPVYTDRGGLATTDAAGAYAIDSLPAGPVTITSLDQVRVEQGLVTTTIVGNATITANVLIVGGTGTVQGVVVSATGLPVSNALIGGGAALVRSDAAGAFVLADVPIGSHQISALDETTAASASAAVNLLNAGDVANVRIVLPGQGSIAGRVFQADGQTPMASVKVFLLGGQIASTVADANGGYRFDRVPLGAYRVSAFQPDFSDGNIVDSKVDFQGEVHVTNVVARGKGTVTGLVVAADGKTPLMSHVGFTELLVKTGVLAPAENPQCVPDIDLGVQTIEMPKCETVAIGFGSALNRIVDTDIAGTFAFGNVFVGSVTVEAANGFSPSIIRAAGTVAHAGDTLSVVLQLQATSVVKGTVYQPDGVTAVGANVVVAFTSSTLGNDPDNPFTVTTDEHGAYLFPLVNPGTFSVTARDTLSGSTGLSDATVDAGTTANVKIRLLGKAPVKVRVSGSNGVIAGALVSVARGTFPNDSRQGQTGADGSIVFGGGDVLTEGPFAVTAFDPVSGITGYASGTVPGGGVEADVQVRLDDQSGSVNGRFLMPDAVTPIPNAQVHITSVRGQAFATTDAGGSFSFDGVFGDFTAEAFDPVTARRGRSTGALTANHQSVSADITAVAQGMVKGYVRFSKDSSPAAAADVTLFVNSAFGGQLVTSTGVDGSFTFPGVSAGALSIQARDSATGISGSAAGSVVNEGDLVTVEIVLQVPQLGRVQGSVHRANGAAALGAQVVLSTGARTTVDNDGFYSIDNVPIGPIRVAANAAAGLDGGFGTGELKFDGDVASIDVTFIGTGTVTATVHAADGTAVPFASVSLSSRNALQRNVSQAVETDAQGRVQFAGIPVGDVSATAIDNASGLAGSAAGQLGADGALLDLQITLQPAAAIRARVFRQDRTTAASGLAVELVGQSQRFGSTAADGSLAFDNLALGAYQIAVTDPLGTGIVKAAVSLAQEGQIVDLGALYLDESPPSVLQIVPANGAAAVPVAQTIHVTFSEPVDATTVTTTTLPVSTPAGPVPGVWTLGADKTSATFTPASAYHDFTAVSVKVTTAVTDLAGKPLANEARSTFITADSTPPLVVSRTPAPGARDVVSESVIRVAYSEAFDPGGFGAGAIVVSRNGAPIDGRTDFTLSNTVVVFTPAAALVPNAIYTVTVKPAVDVFGNAQLQPSTYTFATTDTIAPAVDALTAAGGTSVKVGLTATITATVSAPDVASVDLLINGAVVQTRVAAPFTFAVPVAASLAPSFTVAARATDVSGNAGAVQTLQLTVVPDLPPAIAILSPADGTIVNTGAHLVVSAHATDDIGVSQIGFQASGAVNATSAVAVEPSAPLRDVTFPLDVPADAVGGSQIVLKVAAIDTAGQSSPTSSVSVVVADTTSPVVHITAPAANALVDPGQTVLVTVAADDAGGVSAIALHAEGAATFSGSSAIVPAQSSAQATFQVPVPSSARPTDLITLTAAATDAFGNAAAPVSVTISIRDSDAPAAGIAIDGGVTSIQPGRTISFTVSATDDGGVARLGYETSGAFVASATQSIAPVQRSASGHFSVTVPANTAIGSIVTIVGSATDGSGNVGRSTGAALTIVADQLPSIHIVTPSTGGHLVEGEPLTVAADASDDVGIVRVEFRINGNSIGASTSAPYAIQTVVPGGADGSPVVIEAIATDTANQTSRDSVMLTLNADSTPPRVTSVTPADQATDVSISTPVIVTFTEPIDPVSVNAGSFRVSSGSQAIAGVLSADGSSTVRFTALQPLPLGSTITVSLSADITDRFGNALVDADGNPLAQPLAFSFVTGAFAITNPVAESGVVERTHLVLEARGSSSLGIATVVFAVNGAVQPSTSSGPVYTVGFDVPAASRTPTLAIVATARDAAGHEIATDHVTVNVTVGLQAAPSILGVPLGGTAIAHLTLSSALTSDLPVTLEAVDGTVVTVPQAPVVIPAGQTAADAAIQGATVGNTTVIAGSSRGSAAIVASVSEPVPGQTLTPVALPAGASLPPAPLAAEAIGAPASQLNVAVRVTGAPVSATTAVSATSSDDAIARVVNSPVVAAGQQVAGFTIATGHAGVATLTVRAGGDARSILVVVGDPAANQTMPALAAPTAVSIAPTPTAVQLFAPTAARQTITVRLLPSPAAADTPVAVTTSNAVVAAVDGQPIVRAGEQVVTLTIATGASGVADLLLAAGGVVADLTVAVGPTSLAPPPIVAPPIGIDVIAAPSAGRIVAAAAHRQTIGVRLLALPAAANTPVAASSDNPAVADVVSASDVAAGGQVSQITIATGAPGTATIVLRTGGEVRELTIVVGGAQPSIPAIVAPPVGASIQEAPLAGIVISPTGSVAVVGLRLLTAPAANDIVAVVTTSNPNVASVQSPVVIHAGEQTAQLGIATLADGVAEVIVKAGNQTARFTVIAGAAPAGTVPIIVAPIVGVRIQQ